VKKSGFFNWAVLVTALMFSPARAEPIAIHLGLAVVDKSLPESVRDAFDDDDGKAPLKSVAIDLNKDKIPEKLIPNEFLCGNGGCPWLVYSSKLNKVIGQLFGSSIVVLDASTAGYKDIQTRWSQGAGQTGSSVYRFRNGVYEKMD
jgi:hypothetical protein